MAAEKFLQLSSGVPVSKSAKDSSSGAGDAGKLVALDSGGKISPTMLRENPVITLNAKEALSAGDFINIFDDSGTVKMRKADNTNAAKMAHGFVADAVSQDADGSATIGEGVNNDLGSLTKGARYFLGTSGGVTTTAPTSTNTIVQQLGFALSATELAVNIMDEIKNEA